MDKTIKKMAQIINSADCNEVCKGIRCLTCPLNDLAPICYKLKALYMEGFRQKTFRWGEKTLSIINDILEDRLSILEIAKKHCVSRTYIYKIKNKIKEGIGL